MKIQVLNGVRYTPDMLIRRLNKSRKITGIEYRCVNTLYSLCWVFQFRIGLQVTKKTRRYAGYYAGFDESVLSPGKLSHLPSGRETDVETDCVLRDKLTEEEALQRAWDYNREFILKKFRNLYAVPELEDHVTERFYKPVYLIEFYNLELDEKKYKVLDSLTGDLDDIFLTEP